MDFTDVGQEMIPAPGSRWSRPTRRGGGWPAAPPSSARAVTLTAPAPPAAVAAATMAAAAGGPACAPSGRDVARHIIQLNWNCRAWQMFARHSHHPTCLEP